MKIAVLSGKGGTGKTFISVNLAAAAEKSIYIDCDVEEPNGYLFLKPDAKNKKDVDVWVPFANENLCNGCRKCVDFCKFNALAYIKDKLIVFDEICHSCGGCILFCLQNALSERNRKIGEIHTGLSQKVTVITGILDEGQVSGVPIIKNLLADIASFKDLCIIDCPPGSACIVMESIKDADFCLLVAEPTIFGAHNLSMVHELVKIFNKPFGVVLNKCTDGKNPSRDYCSSNYISILAEIPYDSTLGNLISQGKLISKENASYNKLFSDLLDKIKSEVIL